MNLKIHVAMVMAILLAWQDSSQLVLGQVQDGSEAAAGQVAEKVAEKAQEVGSKLNESETVKELSAGLLQPIFDLAQYMAHPWFYWLAFAVMATGVVSFALQLVFTKLLLLVQFKLNLQEVLSDALGLLISLAGLVVVTQAAVQNSDFTKSPAAVVSSAALGVIAGFVFYLWGQKTEFRAARAAGNPVKRPPQP